MVKWIIAHFSKYLWCKWFSLEQEGVFQCIYYLMDLLESLIVWNIRQTIKSRGRPKRWKMVCNLLHLFFVHSHECWNLHVLPPRCPVQWLHHSALTRHGKMKHTPTQTMAHLSTCAHLTRTIDEHCDAVASFEAQTIERSAVSLILLQPQRVEGEVLASDTLPPQHTRQARSAPAPPSGQQANYNQALDDADLRSSLSQILGRLLSRKGENRESRDKVNRASYFCLSRRITIFIHPLSALLRVSTPLLPCDRPSLTLCLSLTIWHFPASFLLSPIPSLSLRPDLALLLARLNPLFRVMLTPHDLENCWIGSSQRKNTLGRGNCNKKWKQPS